MSIVINLLASLFIVLAVLMFWSYRRLRHYGLVVMGITYGASGGLAFALHHWWPLVAGFALVWGLKLIGLNPDADILGEPEEAGKGAEDGTASQAERPR